MLGGFLPKKPVGYNRFSAGRRKPGLTNLSGSTGIPETLIIARLADANN